MDGADLAEEVGGEALEEDVGAGEDLPEAMDGGGVVGAVGGVLIEANG